MNIREQLRVNDRKLGIKLLNKPEGIVTGAFTSFNIGRARRNSDYALDRSLRDRIETEVVEKEAIIGDEAIDSLLQDIRRDFKVREEKDPDLKLKTKKAFDSNSVDFSTLEGYRDILENESIKDTVRSYYGSDFQVSYSMVLCYEPNEGSELEEMESTRNWHLGLSSSSNVLRMLVFLTDETEGGPLEILSAKQTKDLLEEYTLKELKQNPEIVEKNADVRKYNCKKGSVLFFNPLKQLHRGGNPAKGESRYVMPFTIKPVIKNNK